jgi:hypothetical protein
VLRWSVIAAEGSIVKAQFHHSPIRLPHAGPAADIAVNFFRIRPGNRLWATFAGGFAKSGQGKRGEEEMENRDVFHKHFSFNI